MKAKFKMNQQVRCVNELQPKTIIGIVESGGYHYDLDHGEMGRTLRVAEPNLVDFKTGKCRD